MALRSTGVCSTSSFVSRTSGAAYLECGPHNATLLALFGGGSVSRGECRGASRRGRIRSDGHRQAAGIHWMSGPGGELGRRMQALVEEQQASICETLESLDGQAFQKDRWERAGGGGGLTSIFSDGGFSSAPA